MVLSWAGSRGLSAAEQLFDSAVPNQLLTAYLCTANFPLGQSTAVAAAVNREALYIFRPRQLRVSHRVMRAL